MSETVSKHKKNNFLGINIPKKNLVDDIASPDFIKIDYMKFKPKLVSSEIWRQVFPYDMNNIIQKSALLFLKEQDIDKAVLIAMKEIEFDYSYIQDVKDSFFSDTAMLLSFNSQMATANANYQKILNADNPIKASFLYRKWHSKDCLVCGKDIGKEKVRYLKADDGVVDFLHEGKCFDAMKVIGPAFGNHVVSACEKLQRDIVIQEYPSSENVDPDDWSSYADEEIVVGMKP